MQALPVGRPNALRSQWIERSQFRMQGRPAFPFGTLIQFLPQGRIGGRQRRQPVLQRMEIQERPARKQRNAAAPLNILDQFAGIRAELPGGIRLPRVANVDQVMRGDRQNISGRLRRADVHVTVDHGGVHADDLAREALRQADRDIGLAGRGRPDDTQHEGSRVRSHLKLAHRPRENSRSSSCSVNVVQVGRP